MSGEVSGEAAPQARDWVAGRRSYLLAWGLPSLAIIAAILMGPATRTGVWAVALVWMGLACLANARRCGRTHCHLTGPFFLAMAAATLLHGLEILWLGPHGWIWLGVTLVAGGYGALWLLPELIWGKYRAGPRQQG
ncbi:MAG: hypothetical protein OEM59_13900 [Rhodospirillales bacterium]|nr:hypothetical protein [Rhodospirillales bacterium]